MVRKKKEAVMETSNVGVDQQRSLEKEIKILSRFLADKDQTIEWTKIKLERMRLDFQRMQVQNSKLALSNSGLLADLHSSRAKQRLLQHENGCKQVLLKVMKDQLIKEPNALSSSEPGTSNKSEPDSLCIKCDRGGNLLVCSEVICPLTCHMECLGSPPHFDSVGRFLCPYCAYKLVMLEVPKAEKEMVLAARKALSVFLDKQVVDDDAGGPVSEETDMVQGTDQNLTLNEVVHKFSDKVQFDLPEVWSDYECGTSGVPCDAATSSALSELNGMLGNVSRKSDKGRDSHGEEETADRVELEPRQNAKEKNPITLDSCQQTKVGVESGKPVVGIVYDSEVELEKITEGILNDTETKEGNPPTVDSRNKTMSHPRQIADLVRKMRNLGGEPEKDVEEQRRNLGGETEKTVLEQFKSRQRRKKCPWTTEEEEKLKEGVARFAKSNKNVPWKKILEFGRGVFHETRVAENLKDKWRKLELLN